VTVLKETVAPDFASLQASRSTRPQTVLRSRFQSAYIRRYQQYPGIRATQRIERNGPAWLRCLVIPVRDCHPLRSEELLDRERPRRPLRQQRENRWRVLVAAILARSRGSGRHRPENESSSLLQGPFPFRSLEAVDHVGRERVPSFELFITAILILQVGFNFLWVFQDEGDRSVDLRQRLNRRVGLEDSVRRPPASKIVNHHVQTNSRTSHLVATVADLDVFVGRHHPNPVPLILLSRRTAGVSAASLMSSAL
jgi:hypothetical protein